MSHEQFAYDASAELFGVRTGAGPLIVAVDTNVVIDITEQLEAIDHLGLGVLAPDAWHDETAALADLVAVWFWRDLRFFVSASILDDARVGPLREDRLRARAAAVEAFAADYWQRGGSETAGPNELSGELECLPPRPPHELELQLEMAGRDILPPGFDGQLVREALEEGCHGLLTRDRDITRCAQGLHRIGLWVGTPAQLLHALLGGGEFSRGALPRGPAPDFQSLATFYSLQEPDMDD